MKKAITRVTSLLLVVLVLFALTACGSDSRGVAERIDPITPAEKDSISYSLVSDDTDVPADRKIIKTVDETVETRSYDAFIEELTDAVRNAGGYFSSSQYSGNGFSDGISDRSARFVIRIPAEHLDAFTAAIGSSKLAGVTSYREEAEDVTLDYIDVESRIGVLEDEEAALGEMLRVADTIDNMLRVRDQLTTVQKELASLRGQKKYYDDKIGDSTVNLRVYEVERVSTVGSAKRGFFAKVGEIFVDSLYSLGVFLRGTVYVFVATLPYLLLFGGVFCAIFFPIRAVKKKKNRK